MRSVNTYFQARLKYPSQPIAAKPKFLSNTAQPAKRPINKPVLLVSDIDDTFLAWNADHSAVDDIKLANLKKVLKENQAAVTTVLNTGRGLSLTKVVAPYLKNVDIDYLVLQNGQELYINKDNKPADEWLKGLTHMDKNIHWDRYLNKKTGWSFPQYRFTFNNQLLIENFKSIGMGHLLGNAQFNGFTAYLKPINAKEGIVIYRFEDHAGFGMMGVNFKPGTQEPECLTFTPQVRQYADAFLNKLLERLKSAGMDVRHREMSVTQDGTPPVKFPIFSITPNHFNKDDVVDGMIRTLAVPNTVKGVITAGDSPYNDIELLRRTTFSDTDGNQNTPSYAIQSGNRPEITDVLKNHPRTSQVDRGDLAPALKQFIGQILNTTA